MGWHGKLLQRHRIMSIKSSGKLKFSDIENEFGQAESQYGRSMSNYRRAYDYGDMELPLDSGLPTSGSISFSDFYSKELNVIVDAYSGGTAYQINAKTLWENNRTNVGDSRLTKSASAIKNCKNVIVHVNKRIGSVTEDQIIGQDQVAFRTGDWSNGTNLKIYVGGEGLIAGGGGKGGHGGIYAWHGYDGGNGSSGLGIDYTPTEVTVMASNHPLRKSSGTPGAIVGGCGGGGGGAGADFWMIILDNEPYWNGDFEMETVTVPVDPPTDPPTTTTVTRIKQPPEKIMKDWFVADLERFWSGGGGGGGGAGLPPGKGGTLGGPTGTIPVPAGNWAGRGQPSNQPATNGDDGASNLSASNLTSSGRGGDGGEFGRPACCAWGGLGGHGGEYSSVVGMDGNSGQPGNLYGSDAGPNEENVSVDEKRYSWNPSAFSQKSGGGNGLSGYAVLCSSSWSNYGSNHDSSRVKGGFWQRQPKQG